MLHFLSFFLVARSSSNLSLLSLLLLLYGPKTWHFNQRISHCNMLLMSCGTIMRTVDSMKLVRRIRTMYLGASPFKAQLTLSRETWYGSGHPPQVNLKNATCNKKRNPVNHQDLINRAVIKSHEGKIIR